MKCNAYLSHGTRRFKGSTLNKSRVVFESSLRYIINLNEDTRCNRERSIPVSLSTVQRCRGSRLCPLKFCVTQATSINENRLPIRTGAYTARQKLAYTHHVVALDRPVGDGSTFSSLYTLIPEDSREHISLTKRRVLYLSLSKRGPRNLLRSAA